MPEFYIIIAQKIFSPNFRGTRAPFPPASYAYGKEVRAYLRIWVAFSSAVLTINDEFRVFKAKINFRVFWQRRQHLSYLFFLDEILTKSKTFWKRTPFHRRRSLELGSFSIHGRRCLGRPVGTLRGVGQSVSITECTGRGGREAATTTAVDVWSW